MRSLIETLTVAVPTSLFFGIPVNKPSSDMESQEGKLSIEKLILSLFVYFLIVILIVLVQDSYKRVNIVSAKQLNFNYTEQSSYNPKLKKSYIPIKLNQGGIMPLVFSTTVVTFLIYTLQLFLANILKIDGSQLTGLLTLASSVLNLLLVIFFSTFYALLVLKPKDLADNLAKMAYNIPGLKQGKTTTRYLQKTISRLAFMGGIFLAFLAFFPVLLGNFLKFNIFKNLTSLLILIGVITDVTSQIKGYLVSQNYENFEKEKK